MKTSTLILIGLAIALALVAAYTHPVSLKRAGGTEALFLTGTTVNTRVGVASSTATVVLATSTAYSIRQVTMGRGGNDIYCAFGMTVTTSTAGYVFTTAGQTIRIDDPMITQPFSCIASTTNATAVDFLYVFQQ